MFAKWRADQSAYLASDCAKYGRIDTVLARGLRSSVEKPPDNLAIKSAIGPDDDNGKG
jgi:hypothetical protein